MKTVLPVKNLASLEKRQKHQTRKKPLSLWKNLKISIKKFLNQAFYRKNLIIFIKNKNFNRPSNTAQQTQELNERVYVINFLFANFLLYSLSFLWKHSFFHSITLWFRSIMFFPHYTNSYTHSIDIKKKNNFYPFFLFIMHVYRKWDRSLRQILTKGKRKKKMICILFNFSYIFCNTPSIGMLLLKTSSHAYWNDIPFVNDVTY